MDRCVDGGVIESLAGVRVAALAEQFGTPTYVYEQERIEARIAQLRDFPTIRYAQKANSNIAVLAIMRRHGVLVDAVSAGEVHRALTAGYRPEQVVLTADVFGRRELDLLRQMPVAVNAGSVDMITQFAAVRPGGELTLRINPGFGHGHSQKTNTGGPGSKHGIWHEQLPECLRLAADAKVRISGIHMHIGSGTDFEHLTQVCSALENAALLAGEHLTHISAGGGLPIPYRREAEEINVTAYARLWLETRDRIARKLGRPIDLEVEPGRFLVADSGHLIAEIRAVKSQGGHRYYVLDAGFNNLARPVMYGAYHPMSVAYRAGQPAAADRAPIAVGGPLCESGDIFTQAEGGFVEPRLLPSAQVGDFLVIHVAGAYGFSMGSNYNSMPYAAEVLLHAGQAELIRARQSSEDLIRGERIPDSLR